MRLELSTASAAKLEDIMEQLYNRYDLEELTPEELVDALLDVGVDLIVAEPVAPSMIRDRLINLCSYKIAGRT